MDKHDSAVAKTSEVSEDFECLRPITMNLGNALARIIHQPPGDSLRFF